MEKICRLLLVDYLPHLKTGILIVMGISGLANFIGDYLRP